MQWHKNPKWWYFIILSTLTILSVIGLKPEKSNMPESGQVKKTYSASLDGLGMMATAGSWFLTTNLVPPPSTSNTRIICSFLKNQIHQSTVNKVRRGFTAQDKPNQSGS